MPIFKVSSKLKNESKLEGVYSASTSVDNAAEKQIAEQYGNFAFASKFRFATEMPENSTVETTFPTAPKHETEVKDVVRTNASSEYDHDDTGAPNPPSK